MWVISPYDLRHACLSTWLNGGVYPTQVAEWAGYSVDVLYGSTPSALLARTSSPSAGSAKRCAKTDVGTVRGSNPGFRHALGTASRR
jgi:hypothetical protein